jgi:putative ABC transport system ATP-binding protein
MIKCTNLEKTFTNGDVVTPVLKGVNLEVKQGEFVAIMGRSGAGKSTLMYQLSLLDEPTGGDIFIEDFNTKTLSRSQKTKYRLHNLGYIFQDYALLPELTALENVVLPLLMQGKEIKRAEEVAIENLDKLGLKERHDNLPSQLSGGEQQRVSIARAIAHNPKILFADEPTANLDGESASQVVDALKKLNKQGQTIIMITHEKEYGKEAQRIVNIAEGVVESDKKVKNK